MSLQSSGCLKGLGALCALLSTGGCGGGGLLLLSLRLCLLGGCLIGGDSSSLLSGRLLYDDVLLGGCLRLLGGSLLLGGNFLLGWSLGLLGGNFLLSGTLRLFGGSGLLGGGLGSLLGGLLLWWLDLLHGLGLVGLGGHETGEIGLLFLIVFVFAVFSIFTTESHGGVCLLIVGLEFGIIAELVQLVNVTENVNLSVSLDGNANVLFGREVQLDLLLIDGTSTQSGQEGLFLLIFSLNGVDLGDLLVLGLKGELWKVRSHDVGTSLTIVTAK